MSAYDKLCRLIELFGSDMVLEHVFDWLPTSEIEECLDDLATDYDIEF